MGTALLLHLFFPNASNNHRARLLQPLFVALSILVFLGTQLVIPVLPRLTPVVLGYTADITPERIVELTNKERTATGAPTLRIDPLLTQAALAKASHMMAKGYWAHVAPDGTEPWYFFTNAGYQYRYAGENLARDFSTPETAVSAWMASPTHRDNLLAPRYEDIGVAVVVGDLKGVKTTLVVQLLGKKLGPLTVPEVGAASETSTVSTVPISSRIAGLELGAKSLAAKNILIEDKLRLISPFSGTKRIALFLVSLFLVVFALDVVIVHRRNIARRSSRSFAHLMFLGMILIVILASKAGLVL
ncbi:MAG: CAP domain-containing protein [bacterium]|nr:CAP domain-containing protein [bacterium]